MKRTILLLCILISGFVHAQDLNLGLRAYYPFNGDANDASGNNNHPVFNNATLTADAAGNPNSAYHFNGMDTYMQILNSPSLNMNITMSIAVTIRPIDFYMGPCYNNMMLMKGDADYLDGNYSLRFSDVYTGCTAPTTTQERFMGFDVVVAQNPVITDLNVWHTVVSTYDGTMAKIYVDCILRDSVIIDIPTFTNTFDLYLGHLNDSQYPYWLNGDLDEVRIYDRALTQAEVELYGKCVTTSPIVNVNFAATVVDNKRIRTDWDIDNETGINAYTIERSLTNLPTDFVAIGTLSKNNHTFYSYLDNSAVPNKEYYYRLAMLSNAGVTKYSETRTAKIINNNFYTLLYPNPTNGLAKLFINNVFSDVTISIISDMGQVLSSQKLSASSLHPVNIDLSNVPKGAYFINIRTPENIAVEKIIKL